MTVSAPTLRSPRRGAHASRPAALAQVVLSVEFSSTDGRTWRAIGGGNTLAEAVAFAHESCPADTTWQPVGWNELYGD